MLKRVNALLKPYYHSRESGNPLQKLFPYSLFRKEGGLRSNQGDLVKKLNSY